MSHTEPLFYRTLLELSEKFCYQIKKTQLVAERNPKCEPIPLNLPQYEQLIDSSVYTVTINVLEDWLLLLMPNLII